MSRSGLKWAAEGMALMLATAGAAVVSYIDLPAPERVEAPTELPAEMPRIIEIELIGPSGPSGIDPATCRRGYSSAASRSHIDEEMVREFVAFVCESDPACETIPPETAICIAEERFFGEGKARAITYVANPFAWVVSGEDQRVFVDARNGEAVAINYAVDPVGANVARALGR